MPESRPHGRLVAAGIVLGILVVIASVAVGRFTAPTSAVTPSTLSAEAGFARDMQVHHDQAVELSLMVRDRTDDPAIRMLAYDIATSQAQQSGQMYGWLAAWGLPQLGPEPPMTWMARPAPSGGGVHDHTAPAGEVLEVMPGYATFEQVAELEAATGVDAERLFLELMIEHHVGGVDMAEAVIERSRNAVVVTLATSIIQAQRSEIGYMEELLAGR